MASPLSRMTASAWPRGGRTDRRMRHGRASRLSAALGVERVLHEPGAGRPDLLIDLQGVPQMRGSFSGVPVQQAAAYPFQRPCLLARCAKLASDGERLSVLALGLLGRRGAQSRARPGCSAPWPGRAGRPGRGTTRWPRPSGLWRPGSRRSAAAPGRARQGPTPGRAGRRGAEQVQGLVLAGDSGRVVSRQPPHAAEFTQRVGLVEGRTNAPRTGAAPARSWRWRPGSRRSAAAPGPGR